MHAIGAEHHARVGRPPQDRLALAEPRKDAAGIGVEQARRVQVAAHREQAIGLAQGGLGRREGASGASARRQGSWRVMPAIVFAVVMRDVWHHHLPGKEPTHERPDQRHPRPA
jgi:hypothetical protein